MKQVIIIRSDLQLPKGKACAQASHASVDATLKASADIIRRWREEGMAKIVVKVPSEKELVYLFQQAKEKGFPASLITDAGRTVVEPGTKTAVAIGPAKEEDIDAITGKLPLL